MNSSENREWFDKYWAGSASASVLASYPKYQVIDPETNEVLGEEPDYGNAAELWMVLEEFTGKKLKIVEV